MKNITFRGLPAALVVAVTIVAGALSACSKEPAAESGTEGAVVSETAAPSTEAGEPAASTAVPAQAGVVIQAQETNVPGVVAELTEASREDGVLTVKVRFRNGGTEKQWKNIETGHGDYGLFYLTAGEQKHFILKDTEGEPLAPRYLNLDLEPGAQHTWWAKFPAPAATIREFDLIIPDVLPFEDIPITEG